MSEATNRKGVLYIVPTPIGNLKDITIRGLEVLKNVNYIACEDTRTAGKLLKLLGLPKKDFISYYDSVEKLKSKYVLERLIQGDDVALISEAGTPLISDPGYKLVCLCIDAGIKVIPLPGPTAFVPALVASGLPTNSFRFFGFPPKRKGLKSFLLNLANETETSVVYVSSHNVVKFINELFKYVEANRRMCVAREISKINEEFIRGTIEEIVTFVNSPNAILKGEFVLVLEGRGNK